MNGIANSHIGFPMYLDYNTKHEQNMNGLFWNNDDTWQEFTGVHKKVVYYGLKIDVIAIRTKS